MTPHSLIRLSYPKELPLTLDETKQYLKIETPDEDKLLSQLISKVTSSFEKYTGCMLITQIWQATYKQPTKSITLPLRPIVEVKKVRLKNYSTVSIFDERNYEFDNNSNELRFKVFPLAARVHIEFTVGYGNTSQSIPAAIKATMLNHIAFLFENRGTNQRFQMSNYDEYKTIKI